ncbi:MAG: LptF/LptG family permease [Dysgonomonas sp.]
MLKIKRLYTFIIQTFLPIFMMTFGICLFIVLMQFLWKFVEDLVGKGLDNIVLAELFIYAMLSLIPLALPLALLLASLMAFGNLGERLELLAIKASGVSLLKTMKPLIILVAFVSIGAFFFQNEAMPRIQVKLRSLMISIRQKSPELDIPEGSFYSGITNYSLYVKKKDPKTRILKDVIIYDTSDGFDNMSVFVCDSALMNVSANKDFLLLNLYTGQRFANFRQSGLEDTRRTNRFVPYSRENFKEKKIIIPFNTGFDRMDESNLEGTQISKNIVQLGSSIDSLGNRLDSINVHDRRIIGTHTYLTYRNAESYVKSKNKTDSINKLSQGNPRKDHISTKIDFDSLLATYSADELSRYMSSAASDADGSRFNIMETTQKVNLQKNIRMHKVEWHRKFVLSFACLIFFFIGAPLGAIIRKGGLGMPVVVSVLLFIVYYIIDNVGYKMARDGVWEVWQGMWLSSFALFPLGVFLTYKAMNDSALFNPEAYGKFFNKILFIKTPPKLTDAQREEMVQKIPSLSSLSLEPEVTNGLKAMDSDKLRNIVDNYKEFNYNQTMQLAALSILKEREADLSDITNKQDRKSSEELMSLFEKSSLFTGIGYLLFIILYLISNFTILDLLPDKILIIYIILYIRSFIYYFTFCERTEKKSKKYQAFVMILSLACYPLGYFLMKKKMKNDLENIEIISYLK